MLWLTNGGNYDLMELLQSPQLSEQGEQNERIRSNLEQAQRVFGCGVEMIAWGNTTDRILLLLKQEPMTKAEMCRRLEVTHDQISAVLTRLQRKTPKYDKRIYISGYTRHAINGKTHIRPIYALGNKENAPKNLNKYSQKERSQRHYVKTMNIRNSSVFRQTMTRREINGL